MTSARVSEAALSVVVEVVSPLSARGSSTLLAFRDARLGACVSSRRFMSFAILRSIRLLVAFVGTARSLLGAIGSLIWTIFALFVLAWSCVLRLFFSGHSKVKLLLPVERGRVLVQVVHDAFIRSVCWKRVAQPGTQLLQALFVELSVH